MTEVVVHDKSC